MEKARGTLIKKIPLTETSLITVWCTEEQGLVRTAAKGARRPNSPFAGRLDLFYQADLSYSRAKSGDLHSLREVQVLDYRPQLGSSYLRVLTASYFVKLIEMVCEPESPIPEKFRLLTRALDWLNGAEPTLKGVLHFERELAVLLGLWATGQKGQPANLLRDAYHALPEQRPTLLERLSETGPALANP